MLKQKFEPQIAEGDSSIKNVVQLAVNYSKWKPETEGFKGMIEHGNKLLKSVSNEALQWPLVAWIVASIDRELGRFDDAMKILNTMHSDDEKHFWVRIGQIWCMLKPRRKRQLNAVDRLQCLVAVWSKKCYANINHPDSFT